MATILKCYKNTKDVDNSPELNRVNDQNIGSVFVFRWENQL